jgi:hypothetical protein
MSFSGFVLQLLNGLAGASSLFLVAAGLSLIFGVTRIVNFAHGEMLVIGMYIALILFRSFGLDPLLSVPVAAVILFCFGYALPGEALVLERLILEIALPQPDWMARAEAGPDGQGLERGQPGPLRLESGDRVPLCLGDPQQGGAPGGLRWQRVPLWRREQLGPGQVLRGPALLLDDTGTLVLEPGWQGRLLPDGALLLELRQQGAPGPNASGDLQAPALPLAVAAAKGGRGERASTEPADPEPADPEPAEPEPVDPVAVRRRRRGAANN